ncbi:MAG: imidazoleglycerol-phosphate dehydratase HisB [Thermaerobacter sp.]|nr:imidazoleglycerol-phosphate dehydratase HisB [Thermaerobacter sp.]
MTRAARVERKTRETAILLHINLDQAAEPRIETNLPLFTHFFTAFATHSGFAVELQAHGDVEVDAHHLVEDVGIVLGQAVKQALGDKRGIFRFGQRLLPMDDALVLCALDISGRGQCFWSPGFPDRAIGSTPAEVWPEFFHGFARTAGVTLHMRYLAGDNAHHIYEASFKGFGRALAEAVRLVGEALPSTKGLL